MSLNRFSRLWGRRWGGFLAAQTLGSAQVQFLKDIRKTPRMAGLSHALAASGFHLSVLLGSVLSLTRRWQPGLQYRSGALVIRVGNQRWQLFPSPQTLWALQHRRR